MKKFQCSGCGATGVKLWREYGCFFRENALECADCACKSQKLNFADVREDGLIKSFSSYGREKWTDQIGFRIPLFLDTDNSVFGYTSATEESIKDWKNLPLRMQNKNQKESTTSIKLKRAIAKFASSFRKML